MVILGALVGTVDFIRSTVRKERAVLPVQVCRNSGLLYRRTGKYMYRNSMALLGALIGTEGLYV